MEVESLVLELQDLVENNDDTEAVLLLLNGRNDLVISQAWPILTSLTERVSGKELGAQQLKNYETVLSRLVNNGSPKEILFALLEVCQAFQPTAIFLAVVPYISQVMTQLPFKQLSFDIVLETVSSHIKSVVCLDDYCMTVTDGGELVSENLGSMKELLCCVEKVVTELATPLWDKFSVDCHQNHRDMFVDFLLKLLHYPLLYIHTDDPTMINCCSVIMELLCALVPTMSSLLEPYMNKAVCFDSERLLYTPTKQALASTTRISGVGHVCFLVFCKNISVNYFPSVYNAVHRFSLMLPFLNDLYCQAANSVAVYKTQLLVQFLLNSIADESLNEDFSSLADFRSFVPFSYYCMQYCELEPLRKTASKLLNKFLNKLELKCRFHIYNWILETESNSDVLGHTYTKIKDLVHVTWLSSRREPGQLEKYSVRLISKIFTPPDSKKSTSGNLIDDLNKIAAALNLALYLILRDKSKSSPYTPDMSKYIREYIEPVGTCLRSELESLNKRLIESDDTEPGDRALCSLTVGDETITPNKEIEREAIEAAVSKLELVLHNHTMVKEALTHD